MKTRGYEKPLPVPDFCLTETENKNAIFIYRELLLDSPSILILNVSLTNYNFFPHEDLSVDNATRQCETFSKVYPFYIQQLSNLMTKKQE